jgi:hypothetical protein
VRQLVDGLSDSRSDDAELLGDRKSARKADRGGLSNRGDHDRCALDPQMTWPAVERLKASPMELGPVEGPMKLAM